MRERLRLLFVLLAVSCADSTKPPATVAQATSVEPRSSTEVTVTRAADAAKNPVCESYCRRIAACWLSLSNADPMVAPADAERRCLAEQSMCQRPTADLHCCANIADCREFSHCIETSRNVLSACTEPPAKAELR